MGESANLAFYAIVYAKGLVPRERLQDAMHRATLENLPMEQVLMQWGLLTQPQVDELVGMRRRLGRPCASCQKLTYLLQDQSEDATPCEHCGGKLQPPRRSARMPRPPGQSSARAPGQSSARVPGQSAVRAPTGSMPRPDLDAKLALAEERILAKALECVETRLAQEDLTGFLKAVVKKASQAAVEAIAPQVEELQGALSGLQTGGAPAAAPDTSALVEQVLQRVRRELPKPGPDPEELVEQVLAHVRAELPAPDAGGLAEQAAQSAMEALQEYDLGSLPDRVAQQVLEQLERAGPSDALVDAVAAAVGGGGGGGGGGELTSAHRAELLRQITAELDAKISEPNGLAEQMAQHVLEKIPGLTSDAAPVDAELSPERIAEIESAAARKAVAKVEAKLQDALAQVDERLVAVMAQVEALVEGRVESAVAQLEGRLDALLAKVDKRIARAVADVPKASIAAPSGAGELTSDAAQQIMDTVETRLSEFDMAFDAVILEATDKAVEAMEQRLASYAPGGGGGGGGDVDAVEITRDVTTQVMRVVERRLAELPEPTGGDGVDEGRLTRHVAEQVLGVVEARLAGLEGGGGGGGDVDVDAIEARILSEVEDRLRGLPAASAGTETTGGGKGNTGVYDRKFIALAREVKQLKDTVSSGGGGGGASTSRQSADLLNSEEFRSLLEARINQALAAAGAGTPGVKKGGELVGLLNTPEFKAVFDQKINQVLTYVKGDLIPSAVKKALNEVESS